MRKQIGMVSAKDPGGRERKPVEIFGEDLMKIARCLIAAAGVGLCLCATARADGDQIPNTGTVAGPAVVKRVIVLRSRGDRVIYVRPAYPIHAVLPANRSWYSATAAQRRRRSLQTSGSADNYNHVAKTLKTGHSVDTDQSDEQADKDSKSADRKPGAKQPEANQSEDAGGLDRLTVQAQKEEAIRPAEPGGIEPR
jgi:hypothetical protein